MFGFLMFSRLMKINWCQNAAINVISSLRLRASYLIFLLKTCLYALELVYDIIIILKSEK